MSAPLLASHSPRLPVFPFERGTCDRCVADLERAHAALSRAVAIAPDDPRYADPVRYRLASTLYRMDRFAARARSARATSRSLGSSA